MIELNRNVFQPHYHIKLSSGFFKDLDMWQEFVSGWNGTSFFPDNLLGQLRFLAALYGCLRLHRFWRYLLLSVVSWSVEGSSAA